MVYLLVISTLMSTNNGLILTSQYAIDFYDTQKQCEFAAEKITPINLPSNMYYKTDCSEGKDPRL